MQTTNPEQYFDIKDTGLFRDDGVICPRKTCSPNIDRLKKTYKFFKDNDFNIITTKNKNGSNFLDVSLDVDNVYHKPCKNVLHQHKYVSKDSNCNHKILDNFYNSVKVRLFTDSSNKEILKDDA